MESPLALYRRYRPETFAEVIGQEHVTEPLRAALAGNRVNHAYLFSGPRGCGKTTRARILARTLNCVQAPVADPCGECDSCRDLARGGPGSIDVIEIDAASHGGVDDARDLREKAFFAPVRSHYKVYIIDEAHMVSTQGFNALLKLVEEPPEHLRFIFATTEPEKVIATIRSRTHHYPFRLIPPRLMSSYLSELCAKEDVQVEPAALPLVVRAGGGSARDTLSVLDQLIGGAGPAGVTHELASGLLGYTPDTLLDEVVDAFAAADGAAVFGVVDKVIETGQDPRRFTEDLLRRLRDLVIVAAVPGATGSGLIDVSEDQGERLVAQAARFGAADLSRAADILATGLTEMRGATAPRLLLELLCARVLLPGADHTTEGIAARLDRLERRASITGTPSAAAARRRPAPPAQDRPGAPRPAPGRPTPDPAARAPEPPAETPEAPDDRRSRRARRPSRPGARPGPRRGRRPLPGRRTPPLARRRRVHQDPPPDGLDPPHPELPGGRPRRQRAHPRLRQRRRPRQLRVQRLRRGGPPGRDRRGRRGLEDRDHRRPGRPARGHADGHQAGDRARARAAPPSPTAGARAGAAPEAAPPDGPARLGRRRSRAGAGRRQPERRRPPRRPPARRSSRPGRSGRGTAVRRAGRRRRGGQPRRPRRGPRRPRRRGPARPRAGASMIEEIKHS